MTKILGKDASLEESLQHFETGLKNLGFDIEVMSTIHDISHIWSVHIRDKKTAVCFSNGKGSSEKAALASAYGEFYERLTTQYFFTDYFLHNSTNNTFYNHPQEKIFKKTDKLSSELLNSELLDFYDPDNVVDLTNFTELTSYQALQGDILAVPYQETFSHETVYFPQYLINNIYASNGMAAGNNKYEARVQALSEILERAAKKIIISKALTMPLIPESELLKHEKVHIAIQEIENLGFKLRVFDASLGGKFPVVCILIINPFNNTCFASFGAHPYFAVALERTLTELLQGREIKNLNSFSTPIFDKEYVADDLNIENHFIDSNGLLHWNILGDTPSYAYTAWDIRGTSEEQYALLLENIASMGYKTYVADYDHLGVYCCRIVVPGLSEIYPVSDLEEDYTEERYFFNKKFFTFLEQSNEQSWYNEFLTSLEESGVSNQQNLFNFLAVPSKPSYLKNITVVEFKLILALLGGDLASAAYYIDLLLENSTYAVKDKAVYYNCLQASIQIFTDEDGENYANYKAGLQAVFGAEIANQVYQVLAEPDYLFGRLHDFYQYHNDYILAVSEKYHTTQNTL